MKTAESTKNDNNGGIVQLCSFRIASRHYGVNIVDTKEISGNIEITPVYHAADAVRGYMNIRGLIHLVIDLRILLGFEPSVIDENTKVILFKSFIDEPFGIIVDKIDDVVTVNRNQIEFQDGSIHSQSINENQANINENINDIVEAVCKLDNDIIVIINAKNILKKIEKKNNHNS